jgi:uncharacterized protein YegP (UPF0339 family)
MAEPTAIVGPVHADCPTCACGKRAPVQPGGSISWAEHEAAWTVYARDNGTALSAEAVAERGGFTVSQVTQFLGRDPKSWRATPAERVATDFVEVFADDAGEYRWHRKAGNGEIISDSGEGYTDGAYAVKMAARLNMGVEIRVPKELRVPVPKREPIEPTVTPVVDPAAPAPAAKPVEPQDGPVIPTATAPLEPPTDG